MLDNDATADRRPGRGIELLWSKGIVLTGHTASPPTALDYRFVGQTEAGFNTKATSDDGDDHAEEKSEMARRWLRGPHPWGGGALGAGG